MRIIDVGQEAQGFIAIGQMATGIIAIGQFATGIIAVGQLARGVFVVGQVSLGVVSVGMGSAGLVWCGAMLGVGGRGAGGVLPLTPSLGERRRTPTLTPLSSIQGGASGWARGRLVPEAPGQVALVIPGLDPPARLDIRLRSMAERATAQGPVEVYAELQGGPAGVICDRLAALPPSRLRSPGWYLAWALQFLGLLAVATAIWALVLPPLLPLFGLKLNWP